MISHQKSFNPKKGNTSIFVFAVWYTVAKGGRGRGRVHTRSTFMACFV